MLMMTVLWWIQRLRQDAGVVDVENIFRHLRENRAVEHPKPAFDVIVVPHAGGIYSYHYAMTQPGIPFVEYCNTSPRGDEIVSVFGDMFQGEPLALDGTIALSDEPGWGLKLNRDAVELKRFKS